jgi:hypothetical protein
MSVEFGYIRSQDVEFRYAVAGSRRIVHDPGETRLGMGVLNEYHFIHRTALEFKVAFVDFRCATRDYPVEFGFDSNN